MHEAERAQCVVPQLALQQQAPPVQESIPERHQAVQHQAVQHQAAQHQAAQEAPVKSLAPLVFFSRQLGGLEEASQFALPSAEHLMHLEPLRQVHLAVHPVVHPAVVHPTAHRPVPPHPASQARVEEDLFWGALLYH